MNTTAINNATETASVDNETGEVKRPTDANGNAIYRVPEGNLSGLKARIDKLNKRAAKLRMEPLVLAEVGEAFETKSKPAPDCLDEDERNYRRVTYTIRIVLVTLTGNCPRINGWTMAATIQHEDGGNILRTVPGFEATASVPYQRDDLRALRDATHPQGHLRTPERNGRLETGRTQLLSGFPPLLRCIRLGRMGRNPRWPR